MRFILCIAVGLGATSAVAQTSGIQGTYMHNRLMVERMALSGASGNPAIISGLPPSPPATVGDVYLTKDYRNATFVLYDQDKVATGYPAKLDLQRNEFDVLTKNGVRALSGARVKSLMWSDSLTNSSQYFLNAKDFKNEENVPYYGFFQVLADGEIGLFKMTDLLFKEADRAMANSVGSKDNQFMKRPRLYYGSGSSVLRLPNRKGIINLLHKKRHEVKKFIEINELDFGKENHIVALFEYYNSLVKQ